MAQIALAAPVQLAARLNVRRDIHSGVRGTRPAGRQTPVRQPGKLHLTARGRVVLVGLPLLLLAAAAMVALGVITAPATASDGVVEPLRATTVTVLDGDSLWGIAAELAPERDPREVVGEIVELNNLQTRAVFPGQELQVPLGG